MSYDPVCYRCDHNKGDMCSKLHKPHTEIKENEGFPYCKWDESPIETEDLVGLERKKTHLCKLASLIAEKAHNPSTKTFMEHFTQIDCSHPDFDQLCIMFKHAVSLSIKIEKSLMYIEGIDDLLLCLDIEVDGQITTKDHIRSTITASTEMPNFCEHCLASEKCRVCKFVTKYGYKVSDCESIVTSINNIFENFINDLKEARLQFIGRNNESTIAFTKYGRIETIRATCEDLETLRKIMDKYSTIFHFREEISVTGDIFVWIYTTKKQYRDHVNHILNN